MDETLAERVARLEAHLGVELGYGRPDSRGNIRELIDETRCEVDTIKAELNGGSSGIGLRTRVAVLWYCQAAIGAMIGVVIGWALRGLIGPG